MLTPREQRELEQRLARVLRGSDWVLACGVIAQAIADWEWDRAAERGEVPRGEVPRWIRRAVRRPRRRPQR
jgi:hypothetical protein